jgi:hypothetical protein
VRTLPATSGLDKADGDSSALNETARKATKSKNTKGSPIKLPSKILAVIPDPQNEDAVYVAEAAGNVKRVNLKVGQTRSLSVWTKADYW